MQSRHLLNLKKYMKRYGILLAVAAGCGIWLWRGGEKKDVISRSDPYRIGVVTKSRTSEYWMMIQSGMETAARQAGAELILFSPESEADQEAQEKLAGSLIKKNVDVLAVAPIDSGTYPEYRKTAEKKGIPIVSYDTPFEDPDVPYVGIDNQKAGYRLAEYLCEALEHQGDIGVIAGDLRQLNHRQRVEGICDYIEKEPNMQVVFVEEGYGNRKLSETEIHKLQDQYPEIRGIIANSAVAALGLVDEVKNHNILVVSHDAQSDSIEALRDGSISALIAQYGYEIGYETISYIDAMYKGENVPKKKILEAELLTGESLEKYDEKYSQ